MERKGMIIALMLAVLASSLSWGASNEGAIMSFAHNRLFAAESPPEEPAFMDAVRIAIAAGADDTTIVAGENNVVDLAINSLNDGDFSITDAHEFLRNRYVEFWLDGEPLPVLSNYGGEGIRKWESSLFPQNDSVSNTCDREFLRRGLVRDEGEFCWGRLWAADLSGLEPGDYALQTRIYDGSGNLLRTMSISISVVPPS